MKAYEANNSHDNKNVKKTIGIPHENRRRIFTNAGWMIPFLTGTVLPALGVGSLSGLANTGVEKLIGNGLYLKKGGRLCQIETDGSGLYLGPTNGKRFETVGMVFT